MNILVTGANGFIGRALCDKLLADGYQVRGAVRGQEKTEVSRLRTRRAPAATVRARRACALSRQEATPCQGGQKSEVGSKRDERPTSNECAKQKKMKQREED